jgi:hypothetical protein
MGIALFVLLVMVLIYGIVDSWRDHHNIIYKAGDWLELKATRLNDPDNNDPQYIRIVNDKSKAALNDRWCIKLYEYFEPNGRIKSSFTLSLDDYRKVPSAVIQAKLKRAYDKHMAAKCKGRKAMQKRAFNTFTK